MTRLSSATIGDLPSTVAVPSYDRSIVKSGVVHLGIGAFHRAHQAVVFEAALESGDLRWGITGASLRSAGVRDEMNPQDGLYTVVTRDGSGDSLKVMGVVREVLVAPENPKALVERLAHPDTHIVTLTVTEKGYKLDPATGALLAGDPDVAADCTDLTAPRTAPGFLVAALAARRDRGLPPFTAISCDNLPHNGRRLEQAVLAIARAHGAALAEWIETEGAFPETMVDRIVPATTSVDIAGLEASLGMSDQAMVKAEPFLQWVIEDRFCGPRPAFETPGVQITASVAPWEEAKLRLLNGAHSGIAYLGGLAGIEFVHEVVAIPAFRRFVEALWDEAEVTLSPPPGLDVAAYRSELMQRFTNPALQHRTRQIAMDGSQKLPQRLLASITARRAKGLCVDALALAVAAWMRWQGGRDDSSAAHVVDDPLAAVTAARLDGVADAEAQVTALLSIDAIFPSVLATDEEFRATLTRHLAALIANGARATAEAFA
ncbi:mannitol dehydrogenase family protein [Sphingomonas sp. QA11]|uniref:mannitol dehydrogenase family protein n=1 Tax=Sphingomonas sp. QA11 TaxID=2950605 RepID=UPI00234B72B0|nr:mannitol dehydrogenase family protein [Sphingomonas sp. QA11]WCM25802.1 mannitol dehydrogenase family protein [Sphingomonas sp. QA11]